MDVDSRRRRTAAGAAAALTLAVVVSAAVPARAAAQNRPPNPGPPSTDAGGAEYTDQSRASSAGNFIVPLPDEGSLSSTLRRGKKLFVQRCSVCHLPGLPIYDSYAPLLDRTTLEHKSRPV